MVTLKNVLAQLRELGVKPTLLSHAEIKELPHILVDGEEIFHAVMGWYEGGLGLLCATNHRVLLIDKKPLFLTVEDLRYDMIIDVKYQYRLLEASVCLTYARKSLDFKSWNQSGLRQLVAFVRETNMAIKEQQVEPHEQTISRVSEMVHAQMNGESVYNHNAKFVDMPNPSSYAQIEQPSNWKNPYQTGKRLLRRTKASRFVTQSQLMQ